ncbi:hypothetical protein [Paenibacillus sp. DRB1-1]|uniref:hypothetical protein n=1 Tax=Paenibacillus sp. DRB1-1 TaxID=3422309 RepID=UPI003F9E19D9
MSKRTVDLIRKDVQSAKNEAKKNILLPVREVEDLLALVDSLQQQLAEKDETIQLGVDMLDERDHKIAWLTNELGE